MIGLNKSAFLLFIDGIFSLYFNFVIATKFSKLNHVFLHMACPRKKYIFFFTVLS